MSTELNALKNKEESLQHDTIENQELLKNNANEFLILARLTAIDFSLSDRFEKTNFYFEQSIYASRNEENLFAYAYFLQQHNQVSAAIPYYLEVLGRYKNVASLNPQTYLPHVADTLNNLAVLLKNKNEYQAAEQAYNEALVIRRNLASINPQTHLPYVALTLNNLAALLKDKNKYEAAEQAYKEALQTYRNLAQSNPQTYLPDVAMTTINMSIFYLHCRRDQEMSLALAKEGVKAALPFYEKLPAARKRIQKAMTVIEEWKVDKEAFLQEIFIEMQINIDSKEILKFT